MTFIRLVLFCLFLSVAYVLYCFAHLKKLILDIFKDLGLFLALELTDPQISTFINDLYVLNYIVSFLVALSLILLPTKVAPWANARHRLVLNLSKFF